MPRLQLQVLAIGFFNVFQHIPYQFGTQHVAGKFQEFREAPSVGCWGQIMAFAESAGFEASTIAN
jgi:hypothetical protein